MTPSRTPDDDSNPLLSPLPGWLRRAVAYGLAGLVLSVVAWGIFHALLVVGLVVFALLAAVLLAALLAPLAVRLRDLGLPRSLASLLSLLLLLGVPAGIGYLVYSQVRQQVQDIGPTVTEGIDRVTQWLMNGPVGLSSDRLDELRTSATDTATAALPGAVAGTTTVVSFVTGLLLVLFAVFFLVKDGDTMWHWALGWVSEEHRERVDGGGRITWSTLTAYVRGTALVALCDAIGIGIGLLVLGVPLWLSLALLTFVSAFVPIIGATVAGAAAVLVTLVTNGPVDALIVLGIVLVVQQVEGNLLQPLIMSGVVKLHPLVVVSAVTAGTLVLGIAGAVLAVPLVAVAYRLISYLNGRTEPQEAGGDPGDPGDRDDEGDQERDEAADGDHGSVASTRSQHQPDQPGRRGPAAARPEGARATPTDG